MPPQRGFLQAGSTRISFLEWGRQGPHVLLLHGITSNARTWWRVAPRLVGAGFHVFALDMPGHGESEEVAEHGVDSIARLVAAAAAALGLQRVTLIGHSWGGAVALSIAASAEGQALVSRVALLDPALKGSPAAGEAVLPNFLNGIGVTVEKGAPAWHAKNPDWHEADAHWKAEAMLQCRAGAVRGFFTQSGTWEFASSPVKVKMPLLLLVADAGFTIIDAASRAAAERALAPGLGRLAVVQGTTHNMNRGKGYEPTMAVLMDWLSGK